MTTDPLAIANSAELADFLSGRDDDAIRKVLAPLDITDVLRVIFKASANTYLPEEGPHEPAVVQWEILDLAQNRNVWQTLASLEGLAFYPEIQAEPDVTLRMDIVTLLRLMSREIRGIEALSSGALELNGDIQLALELEGWFADEPQSAHEPLRPEAGE